MNGQQTLPYLNAHFDSENIIGYHHFEHRIQRASDSLNLLQIYLVELSKDFKGLNPDQQTCLRYITTQFLFEKGDQNMNQTKPKATQNFVHEETSSPVKQWLKEAQERLKYFASQPDQREAYEREFITILDYNTSINYHYNEGKAEVLSLSIKALQANGMSNEDIIKALQLTPQDQALYLK